MSGLAHSLIPPVGGCRWNRSRLRPSYWSISLWCFRRYCSTEAGCEDGEEDRNRFRRRPLDGALGEGGAIGKRMLVLYIGLYQHE